jgi:hypothetical protein
MWHVIFLVTAEAFPERHLRGSEPGAACAVHDMFLAGRFDYGAKRGEKDVSAVTWKCDVSEPPV